MAAIDKICVNDFNKYLQFKEWCEQQPPLTDKYGKSEKITNYLFQYEEVRHGEFPIFIAPYYVDAYVIRNCPFDFIQKELMLNYGHWSQEKINEAYDCVMHRTEDNKDFYTWLTEDDFKIIDGVITMPNLKESTYSQIKRGFLFSTPLTDTVYETGRHFKCIKHPAHFYNTPYGCKYWSITLLLLSIPYMWYHEDTKTWNFMDEYVIAESSSNTAYVASIRALKRLILKWKLPIGTIVKATGRFMKDEYEFIIKK